LASSWKTAGLPLSNYLDLLYRYAAAGSGILATLSLVTFIPLRTPTAELLRYLGKRTLEIYVTHGFFLIPFTLLGPLWAPIAALFACSMSLLSANLLKRVRPLRILLYGGRR
jgi:fucose 4-O-acetylase-like acetyltransferase